MVGPQQRFNNLNQFFGRNISRGKTPFSKLFICSIFYGIWSYLQLEYDSTFHLVHYFFCEIPIFKHAAMAKDGTKMAFVPSFWHHHTIFMPPLAITLRFKNMFFTKNITLRKLYTLIFFYKNMLIRTFRLKLVKN